MVKNEISLVFLLKKLINSIKFIFITTITFSLIGIYIALTSPIEYKSSTVFIPQNQKQSSSLSGVANLVGINLGSTSIGGDIPSSLYPQISESTKFKRLVLDNYIDLNKKLKLKDFLIDYYKIDSIKEETSSKLTISKLEESCFEILSKAISIKVNDREGFVIIDVLMPVAEYSAILANTAKSVLQQIIIENKIESAQQSLKFSRDQLNSKMMEFDQIQSKLSNFKDSNLNLVNSLTINEQYKLEAEFNIINTVVTELSKQVEQAKLQVKKDTPVFSTIKEPFIPNYRTNPKRTLIVITYGLIGFIFSVLYTLIKEPIIEFLILLKK